MCELFENAYKWYFDTEDNMRAPYYLVLYMLSYSMRPVESLLRSLTPVSHTGPFSSCTGPVAMLSPSSALSIIGKNKNQEKYIEALNKPNTGICLGIGPAGTGKTLFACLRAINALKKGEVNKIVLTRPIVSVEDEELGFLPGSINKKMDPWVRPIYDIFLEQFPKRDVDRMMQDGVIEIAPLGYMRGRTFKNTIIIADEIQNASPIQVLMLTTRLGTGSKLVITGDLEQSDIGIPNGLSDLLERINYGKEMGLDTEGIEVVKFSQEDVERSQIVKKVLTLYSF